MTGCVSNRDQSFALLCETNDWFLYGTRDWAEKDKLFSFKNSHRGRLEGSLIYFCNNSKSS